MVRDVAARVRVACAESGARRSTGPGSASGQGVRALALFNVGTQICLKWQVLRRTFYQTCGNESRVAVEGRGLERYAYGLRSMYTRRGGPRWSDRVSESDGTHPHPYPIRTRRPQSSTREIIARAPTDAIEIHC